MGHLRWPGFRSAPLMDHLIDQVRSPHKARHQSYNPQQREPETPLAGRFDDGKHPDRRLGFAAQIKPPQHLRLIGTDDFGKRLQKSFDKHLIGKIAVVFGLDRSQDLSPYSGFRSDLFDRDAFFDPQRLQVQPIG